MGAWLLCLWLVWLVAVAMCYVPVESFPVVSFLILREASGDHRYAYVLTTSDGCARGGVTYVLHPLIPT